MRLGVRTGAILKQLAGKCLTWGLPLLGAFYVFRSLSFESMRSTMGAIGWLPIGASLVAMGVCFLFLLLNSFVLLNSTQCAVPFIRYAQIWFIGNMGKYIPGKVFLVFSRANLMQTEGVGLSTSMPLLVAENLLLMFSAGVAYVAGSLMMSGRIIAGIGILLGPAAIMAVLTRPFMQLVNFSLCKFSKDISAIHISGRAAALSVTCGSIAWAAYAFAGSFLATGLGLQGMELFPLFLGVLPFSWLVGFIVIFAPGGIGVREASMVALLESLTGASAASIISILLRLLWVLVELSGYLFSSVGRFKRDRRCSQLDG